MTLQIRWLVADPYSLDYKEEWTEWGTILDHADWVPDNANKFDVREKPIFEPGYFVLVQDARTNGAPWLVKWFDEQPLMSGWHRAEVVNDHLD